MITVSECASFAGLASNELVLGAVPSPRHHSLLSSYLLNIGRGPQAVRDMIIADMRRFLDLGVSSRAADLLIVLRLFLSDFPEARRVDEANRAKFSGAPEREDLSVRRFAGALRAAEDKDHVVVSLSRDRHTDRYAARRTSRVADEKESTVANLGSRLLYLRRGR